MYLFFVDSNIFLKPVSFDSLNSPCWSLFYISVIRVKIDFWQGENCVCVSVCLILLCVPENFPSVCLIQGLIIQTGLEFTM